MNEVLVLSCASPVQPGEGKGPEGTAPDASSEKWARVGYKGDSYG